jgi:hypothetical protein
MVIQIQKSHVGLLHKKMGIKQGKPISSEALSKKKKGATGKLKEEIVFAQNSKKWAKGK